MKYPCFKPLEAAAGVVLGKAVKADLSTNLASAQLHADDHLAEEISEFSDGKITMETDDMQDDVAGVVYGCTVEGKKVVYKSGDNPPKGVLAYYQKLMRGGEIFFRAWAHPCCKAQLGNRSMQTKGKNVTFSTTSTAFTVMEDDNSVWQEHETFETEAEARTWVEEKCAIAKAAAANAPAKGEAPAAEGGEAQTDPQGEAPAAEG